MTKTKILAVDDNPEGLFVLAELLAQAGYDVVTASSGDETVERAKRELPDLVLLDVMMPGPNGFEVTKILRAHPKLKFVPIVLLTGRDSLDDIIEGLETGADDYVRKPFQGQELLARVKAVLRVRKLYEALERSETRNRELEQTFSESFSFGNIIGRSQSMKQVFALLAKVADSEIPVLVLGESGTGKELIAKALHTGGARKGKPFVAINCSAFNENLLESELFGYVKGAFTGAIRDKEGLLQAAHTGTIFLDELGEMPQSLQVKLLRVLQEGTFFPVGSTREVSVDVRVIGATHRDLETMVREGKFREDLYYRLNVVGVELPPLRERGGDVPLLVEYFLAHYSKKLGKGSKGITPDALRALEQYAWPGNIRQLENEIQRALVMCGSEPSIGIEFLSSKITGAETSDPAGDGAGGTLASAMQQLERQMIKEALDQAQGNKSEAARKLGMSRSNLIAKAKEFGY